MVFRQFEAPCFHPSSLIPLWRSNSILSIYGGGSLWNVLSWSDDFNKIVAFEKSLLGACFSFLVSKYRHWSYRNFHERGILCTKKEIIRLKKLAHLKERPGSKTCRLFIIFSCLRRSLHRCAINARKLLIKGLRNTFNNSIYYKVESTRQRQKSGEK